jgi:DnaJ-class molecular chaperone
MMKNYYEILEVKSDTSDEVIKAAYRALMKKYHPDNGGNQDPTGEKLRLVKEAYDCLSDPQRRKQYDVQFRMEYSKAGTSAKCESQPKAQEPESVQKNDDVEKKHRSFFSHIVSGVVEGVQGAADLRHAEIENAYYEALELPDEIVLREYREQVGGKRIGYGKVLEERGFLVRDRSGQWRPTSKYRRVW